MKSSSSGTSFFGVHGADMLTDRPTCVGGESSVYKQFSTPSVHTATHKTTLPAASSRPSLTRYDRSNTSDGKHRAWARNSLPRAAL